eukprot:scaffold129917_cov37-Tisochrysis_lutea.AAC.1
MARNAPMTKAAAFHPPASIVKNFAMALQHMHGRGGRARRARRLPAKLIVDVLEILQHALNLLRASFKCAA